MTVAFRMFDIDRDGELNTAEQLCLWRTVALVEYSNAAGTVSMLVSCHVCLLVLCCFSLVIVFVYLFVCFTDGGLHHLSCT